MTTLIPTAILLLSLGGGAATAGNAPVRQEWRAEVMPSADQPSDATLSSLLGAINAAQAESRGGNPWERASRTVFYVPGPDSLAEGMAQTITEDMAIMCRIFDKARAWTLRTAMAEVGTALELGDSGTVLIADDRFSTQGLYLDGYGAIFFIPVGFPLAPTGQEQAPAESESPADPVWSQTANELRGVPQGRPAAESPRYDPQKVENLKTAVIGVLRHASNIRTGKTRKPQDIIDVVISSRMRQTHHPNWTLESGAWQQAADPTGPAAEMPTVLILRTTKTDVDALAKGELTPEQFTPKVQVLKSWTNAGRGGTIRPTAPRTSISAPPQAMRR